MKLTTIQIVLITIIALVLIFVFLLMIGAIPGLKKAEQAEATIEFWGTEDQTVWQEFLRDLQQNKKLIVHYTRVDPNDYLTRVVGALAAGKGPDVWILPSDSFTLHADKIQPAPSQRIPYRFFSQLFPDIAQNYVTTGNVVWGLPSRIDPLVLYWNKDLFNSAALPEPPRTWSQFTENTIGLTKRGVGTEITTAGAALGLASNINYAKEIVSALLLQAGNPIIDTKKQQVVLGQTQQVGQVSVLPAQSIMRFYADFANPGKTTYSWNAALPEAKETFVAGRLAMFIGFASDYESIKKSNPHLNFDAAALPQIEGTSSKTTYANVDLFVVSKLASDDAPWRFITAVSEKEASLQVAKNRNFISPRRDLAKEYEDAHLQLFAENTLFSKNWQQPDPARVSEIFTEMIELIHGNEALLVQAIRGANDKLQALYLQQRERFK